MNNMSVFWLIAFTLFNISHVKNNDMENVIDLNAYYDLDDGYAVMEAYRSIRNEEILNENQKLKFGQLKWYTIGYPTLAHFPSKNSSFSMANLFKMTRSGFDILVEMLTDRQKEMFKEEVKLYYGIDVKTRQIRRLVPSELKCQTEVECSNGTHITLYGKAIKSQKINIIVFFSY